MTRSVNNYKVTPHFTGDETNTIIFLVFNEYNELVLDIQYNNGRFLLWVGEEVKRLTYAENEDDIRMLIMFTREWLDEMAEAKIEG